MRTTGLFTSLLAAAAVLAVLSGQSPSQSPPPGPDPDPGAYGIGFYLGEEVRGELRADGIGADLDLIAKGFRDALNGAEPMAPRAELDEILAALHQEMQDRMVRRLLADDPEFKQAFDANLERSEKFSRLFGEQAGVVTLPSGVQYKPLRQGTGRRPGRGDTVVVTGKVTLLDGTVLQEGTNTVRVDACVPGGAELLTLMPVGSKWQFAIPPAMAHGAAGRFPVIGPNETLVGVAELVSIQ